MQVQTISYIKGPDIYRSTPVINSAAEIAVLGHTVPASYLGVFTSIGFRMTFQVSTTAIVGPTLTVKLKFGSASLTVVSSSLAAGLVNKTFRIEGAITNQNALNAQAVWGEMRQPANGIFGVLAPNIFESSASDWQIDTMTDQLAQATVQFSTASTSNSVRMIQGSMTFG